MFQIYRGFIYFRTLDIRSYTSRIMKGDGNVTSIYFPLVHQTSDEGTFDMDSKRGE